MIFSNFNIEIIICDLIIFLFKEKLILISSKKKLWDISVKKSPNTDFINKNKEF